METLASSIVVRLTGREETSFSSLLNLKVLSAHPAADIPNPGETSVNRRSIAAPAPARDATTNR